MYIIRNFATLHHISVIILDIDGTITDPNGEVNHEVAAKIINLGQNGICHLFITGRDAAWIIKNVINPMKKFYGFSRVHDNMVFFAEVGCVILIVDARGNVTESIHPAVENHPLRLNTNNIRDILKKICHNPENLQKYEENVTVDPVTHAIIYDVDKVGWLVPRIDPAPELPQHI